MSGSVNNTNFGPVDKEAIAALQKLNTATQIPHAHAFGLTPELMRSIDVLKLYETSLVAQTNPTNKPATFNNISQVTQIGTAFGSQNQGPITGNA